MVFKEKTKTNKLKQKLKKVVLTSLLFAAGLFTFYFLPVRRAGSKSLDPRQKKVQIVQQVNSSLKRHNQMPNPTVSFSQNNNNSTGRQNLLLTIARSDNITLGLKDWADSTYRDRDFWSDRNWKDHILTHVPLAEYWEKRLQKHKLDLQGHENFRYNEDWGDLPQNVVILRETIDDLYSFAINFAEDPLINDELKKLNLISDRLERFGDD